MRRPISVARLIPLAALVAPLLLSMPVAAQVPRGPLTPNSAAGPNTPPPALPGLASRNPAPAIPPDANFNNLGPNEALFDSINRGDLGAARDAVSRGADLESHNVLGLTPLEAAVDQGRNDIAFFLLSARGPGRASASPMPPPPPLPGTGRTAGTEPPRRAAPAPRPAHSPAPNPRTAAPRTAPADGGAARPDIGFLGFDAGRGG